MFFNFQGVIWDFSGSIQWISIQMHAVFSGNLIPMSLMLYHDAEPEKKIINKKQFLRDRNFAKQYLDLMNNDNGLKAMIFFFRVYFLVLLKNRFATVLWYISLETYETVLDC